MFKKSLIVLNTILLVGCGTNNAYYQQNPQYKISDEDTKKWIVEGNKIEQCLFSKQRKNKSFNSLPDIEKQLHFNKVIIGSLVNTIGVDNARLAMSDPVSIEYTQKQFKKFNHTELVNFDAKWCKTEKREYAKALETAKQERKKQEKEALARKEQAEKERKAREAYLATPQGQADLARQQYQQALLAQQQMYQQQLEAQRESYQWQQLGNTITNSLNNLANTMNQQANMYNSMTRSMPVYQYQPPSSSSSTCYSYGIGNSMIHCKHQ